MKKTFITMAIVASTFCFASENVEANKFLKKQEVKNEVKNTQTNVVVASEPIQEVVMNKDDNIVNSSPSLSPVKNVQIPLKSKSIEDQAVEDLIKAKESILKLNNPEIDKDFIAKDFDEMIKIIKKYQK